MRCLTSLDLEQRLSLSLTRTPPNLPLSGEEQERGTSGSPPDKGELEGGV